MIIPLTDISVDTFDKNVLTQLKPYFDIDFESTQKEQWYGNLFTLAKHNLGVAHCLFHHWGAKLHMISAFKDKTFPNFYKPGFDQQLGCTSNAKTSDNIRLEFVNGIPTVIGRKHWISNLHQAEFGVFSVCFQDHEAIVLYDFTKNLHKIQTNDMQIGMELARAGSIIDDRYIVPNEYILGYRRYPEANNIFSPISNLMSYAFITNYLGAIVSLFKDLKEYVELENININFELKSLELEICMLKMVWDNNLVTVHEKNFTDNFWHKRNTQYTQSKKILLSLINLILKVGNPRWLDKNSIDAGRRFRDALVFSAHMKTFYNNLHGQHFVIF